MPKPEDVCPHCGVSLHYSMHGSPSAGFCPSCWWERFSHTDLLAAQALRAEKETALERARKLFHDAEGELRGVERRLERVERCRAIDRLKGVSAPPEPEPEGCPCNQPRAGAPYKGAHWGDCPRGFAAVPDKKTASTGEKGEWHGL